jgi:hypothetical protein
MTGSLPDNLEEPRLLSYKPELAHPSSFLLVSFNYPQDGGWAVILNRRGRIIWYQEPVGNHWMLVPRVARSGNHLLLDTDTYWSSGFNEDSTIRRMTIAGEVLETITVRGLHHGFDERTDGTIVWGSNITGFNWEKLMAVDPDGNSWVVWNSNEWDVPGPVASNTTTWVEDDDTFLFSFWTNNTMVEIDFKSGEILRQFGSLPGSWSFDPPESRFYFQHGVSYTDDHTLVVSTHIPPGEGQEQRVREYALDDSTETLIEIWSYGEGEDLYAPVWGEAFRLDNGNTALNTGSNRQIREVTMDGETAWDLYWGGDKTIGHMTYIDGLSDLYALDGR